MAKPYTFKMKLKHFCVSSAMTAFRIFPINRKKIVFTNYFGKGYGDNGKAIAEELLKLDPTLDIVWAAKPQFKSTLPENIRFTEYNSLGYLKELSTAGAWVDNSRKNAGIVKRKSQFYVQAWHGAPQLKQIEKDTEDSLDEFYVAGAKQDSKNADIILSGCKFFSKIVKRAFWFDGEIFECGTPRLDRLFRIDEEKMAETKAKLGIAPDKKVALYAPTFRADERVDCYDVDFGAVLDALERKTGDEWVFLIRLHPNVSDKADFINYSDRIINATLFPDLYELMPISDLIVSDYSSLMFDAGLINKNVMIYASDIETYIAVDRKLYLDIRKLPFPLAQNTEELIALIDSFDQEAYDVGLKEFNSEIGYLENGTAAKTVAERILKELNDRAK